MKAIFRILGTAAAVAATGAAYLHQNKKSFRKEWLFCFGWAYVARETLWFDRMHFCGAKAPLFLHAMQKT